MTVPTTSWDETSPAGSQAIPLGDDRIREMKTQLREVIAADHIMASSGQSSTTGYHNKTTFVEQASSPSMVANTFMLFCKEADSKSELYMDSYDATQAEQQLTEDGNWIAGIQYEVRMFSGLTANIPSGWVLCDGNNDTPDLTDKFIRATDTTITTRAWTAGSGEYGTGGADTATLSATNLPSFSVAAEASHTHSGTTASSYAGGNVGGGPYFGGADAYTTLNTGAHTHSFSTGPGSSHAHSYTGSSTAFSIVPAYVELMFIMKS